MGESLSSSVRVNASRAGTAESLECRVFHMCVTRAVMPASPAVGVAVIAPSLMQLLLGSRSAVICHTSCVKRCRA